MTIEIDDAGTGDLIGSAWIVLWRRERNQLIRKEIPLKLYQQENFDELTKEKAKELIIEGLDELQAPPSEEIYLCKGSIFDKARAYLKEQDYNIIDEQIIGYLQEMVEQTYIRHVEEEYGVPTGYINTTSGKNRFMKLFEWITEDYPRRVKYVKTGFKKWALKLNDEAYNKWMEKMVKPRNKEIIERLRSDPDRRKRRTQSTGRGKIKKNAKTRKTSRQKPGRGKKSKHRPPSTRIRKLPFH